MSLFHCKKCNAIFEITKEANNISDSIISVCPECNSHDVGRVAS